MRLLAFRKRLARLIRKGKSVKSTGYREELHVAAIPNRNAKQCAKIIAGIFDLRTTIIPYFLNLTMTPSNPILHTSRLRTLFRDWHEGVSYSHVPLFYEEWDDESSELLLKCDDEVQSICQALPEFNLQYVKSLRAHYESPTVQEMTKKISSISAFKGLETPSIMVNGRFVPDLYSRYFTSDFSYGLAIIKQIAEFAGVKAQNIDETMAWYKKIAVVKNEFRYEDYGITNRILFEQFYSL